MDILRSPSTSPNCCGRSKPTSLVPECTRTVNRTGHRPVDEKREGDYLGVAARRRTSSDLNTRARADHARRSDQLLISSKWEADHAEIRDRKTVSAAGVA